MVAIVTWFIVQRLKLVAARAPLLRYAACIIDVSSTSRFIRVLCIHRHPTTARSLCRVSAGFKGDPGGPRPSTNTGPPTKPFIFHFSLIIYAYWTVRLSRRALLIIVLVRPNSYSAMCLTVVQFSSPLKLTEFIWPRGLGPSTGLQV